MHRASSSEASQAWCPSTLPWAGGSTHPPTPSGFRHRCPMACASMAHFKDGASMSRKRTAVNCRPHRESCVSPPCANSCNGTPNTPAEHRLAQIIIDEIADLREDPLGLPQPTDERFRCMTDAMLGDLADNRSIQDWAKWVGMTPRTLARHFNEQTGFGMVAWRQRTRFFAR